MEGGGILPHDSYKNYQDLCEAIVKEEHISSTVSEILSLAVYIPELTWHNDTLQDLARDKGSSFPGIINIIIAYPCISLN